MRIMLMLVRFHALTLLIFTVGSSAEGASTVSPTLPDVSALQYELDVIHGEFEVNGDFVSTHATAIVLAQSDLRQGRLNKRMVQEMRSKPKSFSQRISQDQLVLVKRFSTKNVKISAETWPTEQGRELEKRRIADLLLDQVLRRLRSAGFSVLRYEEAVGDGTNTANGIILEGEVGTIAQGIDHPLVTISARTYSANNADLVYSRFSDGGMVGQVTTRIRARFVMSLPEVEAKPDSARPRARGRSFRAR